MSMNYNNNEYFTERSSDLFNSNPGQYRFGNFFGDILDIHLEYVNRRLENLENEMIRIAERESLRDYKTLEKKPGVKININSIDINDKNMEQFSDKNCSICKDQFEKGNKVIILKCEHVLHSDCIEEWVKYKSECPVCRERIDTTDSNNDSDNMVNNDSDNMVNNESDNMVNNESNNYVYLEIYDHIFLRTS